MKLQDKYVDYTIVRECWNDKTFNGYEDAPYWRISFDFYVVSLKDDGTYMVMYPPSETHQVNWHIEKALKAIINECMLNIELQLQL